MTVSFNHAAGAYRDATKVAERILDQVGDNQAAPAQNSLKPRFDDLISSGLDAARDSGYKGEIQSGKSVANNAELHELVTAVSNTELTLNTVVAVRDRVISAYQDIIKMPI